MMVYFVDGGYEYGVVGGKCDILIVAIDLGCLED